MASEAKSHPFHMVNPSPWPALGTASALCLAIGAIIFMHYDAVWLLVVGFGLLFYTFYAWWRDVVRESHSGFHTRIVQQGLRVGMLLFILSEVMFFFAFFWAYFHATVPAINSIAHEVWPPEGVIPFPTWGLPFLNTLILLTSGATITAAHHAVRDNDREKMVLWLGATVVLGIIFLICQAYEYGHAAFGFRDGIYSSTFYLATGFHGFHVLVGTAFLIVCFLRARAGHFSPEKHIGFESAAWYWHFVDVVWLFLFVSIYWWGSSGYTGPFLH